MRFLADMGVGVRVVEWLRSQGHDAVHLREEGLHRAPDEQVLAKAVAEERLSTVLPACEDDLARPVVLVIEEARYRARYLPIGEP